MMIRAVFAAAFVIGCGGQQSLDHAADAAVDTGSEAASADANVQTSEAGFDPALVGAVDLSAAPAELAVTCDDGVGTIAFRNPCLIGGSLNGEAAAFDVHEVECSLATPDHPVTWSFLISLAAVAASPDRPVALPGMYAVASPLSGAAVDVAGRHVGVSDVSGVFTFSRIDPTNRAFIARFEGTMTWKDAAGATFSCTVDTPLWGAPGGFI